MATGDVFQTGKTRHKERAIAALLSKPTIREASEECGVSASTLQRWLRDPDFVAQYDAAKRELMQGATNRLQNAALNAVEVLVTIANTVRATESARVTAAGKVIELAIKSQHWKALKRDLLN